MPIYMDVHFIPGVKAKNVAEAHRLDMVHQDEYHCKCMTYWIDEERGNVFCLLEAPDKDAVIELHRKAHGLLPYKIIEVSSKVVQSFLGRIFDPENTETTEEGLPIINDSSFRILLIAKTTDTFLLRHQLGNEKTNELLQRLNNTVRKNLAYCGGSEVENGQFVVAFTSASSAISCALSIVRQMHPEDINVLDLKIAINAGIPFENNNTIFGDIIEQAVNMCAITGNSRITIASHVNNLVSKEYFDHHNNLIVLTPQHEMLLRLLFTTLKENWNNPDFDIDAFSHAMGMSQSGLYRKIIELTGLPPNQLLKEFRLARAKDLMKQQRYSISQITFDSGFTSPSYFTKCFKKKYRLLPMQYIDLL